MQADASVSKIAKDFFSRPNQNNLIEREKKEDARSIDRQSVSTGVNRAIQRERIHLVGKKEPSTFPDNNFNIFIRLLIPNLHRQRLWLESNNVFGSIRRQNILSPLPKKYFAFSLVNLHGSTKMTNPSVRGCKIEAPFRTNERTFKSPSLSLL